MLKRVGVDLEAMQNVVASASSEDEVLAWFAEHADLSDVEVLNGKLEALGIARLPAEEQAMVYRIHPGIAERPELTAFFDIFEFDDARLAGRS